MNLERNPSPPPPIIVPKEEVRLITFSNRFTRMMVSTDSLSLENSGLTSYIKNNRRKMMTCWHKKLKSCDNNSLDLDEPIATTSDGLSKPREDCENAAITVPQITVESNGAEESFHQPTSTEPSLTECNMSVKRSSGYNNRTTNIITAATVNNIDYEAAGSSRPKRAKLAIKAEFIKDEPVLFESDNSNSFGGTSFCNTEFDSVMDIKLEYHFELPSVQRLREVTEALLECLNLQGDSYESLCQAVTSRGIKPLNDRINPKLLVWDVNIRLLSVDILGADYHDYIKHIHQNLAEMSFERFMDNWFKRINSNELIV